MAAYRVILLTGGDIDFAPSLADQLLLALSSSAAPRLLLQHYHVERLRALRKFDALNATGGVEVLTPWINPATKKGTAISNQRLTELSAELLPFAVAANVSVQYQINSQTQGWILEILNNEGVTKPVNAKARVDFNKASIVTVSPKFGEFQRVMLWGEDGDKQIHGPGTNGSSVQLVIAPGSIAYLQFVTN